jgi:branched-chain amino acid transport system substrate-binding protein
MYFLKARRFRRAAGLVAALAAVTAVVFAESGGANAASGSAAAAKIVLPQLKFPVVDFVKYTAGKAGKANPKLKPVLVGWANNQGGQVLVGPSATQGAETAARWINQYAGGIDGHPVKLVECFIANTEAEGTRCGDQFAATKGLEAIAFGGIAVGASSLEAVVSPKIPIFIGVSVNPGDNTNPNTYEFGGGATQISWSYGTFAKTVLHATTAASVFPNSPGFLQPAAAQQQAYQAEGITPVSVGVDPNSTDYVGPLQAANVTTAGAISPNGDTTACIQIAKALAQLNVPPNHVVSSPLCLGPDVKKALGDWPKWYYSSAQDNLDGSLPETKAYFKILAGYGESASDEDPWFNTAFSEILTAAQFMNSIGYNKLSPALVNQAAKEWHGPFVLGQPVIKCGAYKAAPASCADAQHFYRYLGNGVFKQASGWLRPPKSLQPK